MATADPRRRADTANDLSRAIDALEAVEWTDVPGVSSITAATFCKKLRWAKAALDRP